MVLYIYMGQLVRAGARVIQAKTNLGSPLPIHPNFPRNLNPQRKRPSTFEFESESGF